MDCFPSNRSEALAILYVHHQDLSKMTPEEVAAMYYDAYRKIQFKIGELRKAEHKASNSAPIF